MSSSPIYITLEEEGRDGPDLDPLGAATLSDQLARGRVDHGVRRLRRMRGAVECGWGVSSRDGSRWKSVGVIGSQQQRVFVVVGSCRESLGAIGSR